MFRRLDICGAVGAHGMTFTMGERKADEAFACGSGMGGVGFGPDSVVDELIKAIDDALAEPEIVLERDSKERFLKKYGHI